MEGCVLDLVASLGRKPDWDEAELWAAVFYVRGSKKLELTPEMRARSF